MWKIWLGVGPYILYYISMHSIQMRVYKLYVYYIIYTMLNTMHCCFNGILAFYSLRWTSSKITLYMSLNTVSSNGGYGQQWRTQKFCSGGGGVQQIQMRTEDKQNGDLEAVAP